MCNDLPSPSDWAVGSLAVGPKTKTIPNREVVSSLILTFRKIKKPGQPGPGDFNKF
jgi:hypothetical protein